MASAATGKCGPCGSYLKSILKFLLSHIGLVSLVVGYTIIGAITFKNLESENEVAVKKNMSAVRAKVTDDLWDITNDMLYLEEVEWSNRARQTLKNFEREIYDAIKNRGWDGKESDVALQWTFAGALFYSIVLITTIGYGHIAPKTPWGKVVTIFYAIPGVPLMMLCLANIGDGMAHSFRFLYWKVCCYACTKRPKKKRRNKSTSARVSRTSVKSSHHSNSVAPNRHRSSSFRRRDNTDSYGYNDPAADYRLSLDERGGGMRGSHHLPPPTPNMRSRSPSRGGRGEGKDGDERGEDNNRVPVLYNKYALDDADDLDDRRGTTGPQDSRAVQDRPANRSSNSRPRSMDPAGAVTDQPRRARDVSPTVDGHLPRRQYHLPPPPPRMVPPRLEPPYLVDDDSDEYEVDLSGAEDDPGSKPVPIWLGVMLVVAYILGGAVMFSEKEPWGFLDSVYFCFITLTTIGFGDFVPAQNESEENVEVSIALCSLYLLFGIALLAMSFNLVQEEVISNVKSVAKRLGIIKEEDVDNMQD